MKQQTMTYDALNTALSFGELPDYVEIQRGGVWDELEHITRVNEGVIDGQYHVLTASTDLYYPVAPDDVVTVRYEDDADLFDDEELDEYMDELLTEHDELPAWDDALAASRRTFIKSERLHHPETVDVLLDAILTATDAPAQNVYNAETALLYIADLIKRHRGN